LTLPPSKKPRGRPKKAVNPRVEPPLSPIELAEIQRQKELIEARKKELKDGLPHLYGFKWYWWARNFFNSTNKVNLLCAGNQISKSSTQIRKMIHWATEQKLWPKLWPNHQPRIFWYLYPSKDVATQEFLKKIEPEFLPRGKFKDDPVYGWTVEFKQKQIFAIHFNSGVTCYFKSYEQDVHSLQTGTVAALFCDEELVEELYDELMLRLAASDGYFHMVFTATRGQEFWWRAIEAQGDNEFLPDAFKLQVGMYDCLVYDDGSPSPWTAEKIQAIERRCRSQAEVLKRVYGRFVADEGRKYHAFTPDRGYCKPFTIPSGWQRYAAVDLGSGKKNHKAAICFIAVRPDMRYGVAYDGWRGDGVETTSGDVYEKFKQLRGRQNFLHQCYDAAAKDYGTITQRAGEPFVPANKSHDLGEDVINTLFKNGLFQIFDTPELRKLGGELLSLQRDTPKEKARDDFADAFRYAIVAVPWDWSVLLGKGEEENAASRNQTGSWTPSETRDELRTEGEERREARRKAAKGQGQSSGQTGWEGYFEEIDDWNEAYGT
jgi:hypothetical protein